MNQLSNDQPPWRERLGLPFLFFSTLINGISVILSGWSWIQGPGLIACICVWSLILRRQWIQRKSK